MDNVNNTSFTMPIKDLKREDYGYEHVEYLRELGATFSESHYERYNKHFVSINLPEGFTISDGFISGKFKYRIISDEAGNNRGTFLIKCDNMNIANLIMAKKYRVMSVNGNSGELIFEKICFGNDDVVLFEEGFVSVNNKHNSELYVQSKLADLRKKCAEHADILYPDWNSPLAYWDEEPMIADVQTLARIKND